MSARVPAERSRKREKRYAHKKAVPEFVLCFLKTALKLATGKAGKKFKDIMRPAFDSNSEAAEFHWQIRKFYPCSESGYWTLVKMKH